VEAAQGADVAAGAGAEDAAVVEDEDHVMETGTTTSSAALEPEGFGSSAVAARVTCTARKLTFQWHITERCNLRCQHCYQESYSGAELNFEQWLEVTHQLEQLIGDSGTAPFPRVHINVTGGEPFVHPDFIRLLQVIAGKRELFSFAILSNGWFIDAGIARKLAGLRPRFVQISLEGMRPIHDRIRGAGSFDHAISGIRHLTRTGVPVQISFTAHRGNFREFPAVARLACDLKVNRLWSDRLIPSGAALDPHMESLTPTEAREYFEVMRAARQEAPNRWLCRTEVALQRALQFLAGHGQPYRCTAGESLLALLPNGDLLPCRRLPVLVGNVQETSLRDIYLGSPFLRALREPELNVKGCGGCTFRHACRGGLRCLAFAVESDPFTADPGCWLSRK
jgi:radical SAM protein with 4Fe4S-binding SPASM domain